MIKQWGNASKFKPLKISAQGTNEDDALGQSQPIGRYNVSPSYAQQTRVETQSNDTATSPRDSTKTTTEVLPRRLMTKHQSVFDGH